MSKIIPFGEVLVLSQLGIESWTHRASDRYGIKEFREGKKVIKLSLKAYCNQGILNVVVFEKDRYFIHVCPTLRGKFDERLSPGHVFFGHFCIMYPP